MAPSAGIKAGCFNEAGGFLPRKLERSVRVDFTELWAALQ